MDTGISGGEAMCSIVSSIFVHLFLLVVNLSVDRFLRLEIRWDVGPTRPDWTTATTFPFLRDRVVATSLDLSYPPTIFRPGAPSGT